MKRILLIAAFVAPLAWTACSDNKPGTTEVEIPKGMKALDLTTLGQPVMINVPDSNFFPTIDTMETPAGIQVRIGTHFDILINAAGAEEGDLAKQKELINATDAGMNNFSGGDSATLMWETKFGELSMHHFYRVVKVGNATYFVRDNNSNPDNQFNKQDIERMIESAKSLRAKQPQPEA
jgi:hypothetical protein